MAKLLDPKETVRIDAPGQSLLPEERRVAFHLAVPTVRGRAAFIRAVAKAGGRDWSLMQQLACVKVGIGALLGADDPETAERGAAKVDEYMDWLRGYYERLMSGDLIGADNAGAFEAAQMEMAALDAAVAEISRVVADGYPPYANMQADVQTYPLIRGIEAARLFLMGWENVGAEFRRGSDGVPDSVLGALSDAQLVAIGAEVERLTRPTESEAKNSDSPSPGASTPTDSATAISPA